MKIRTKRVTKLAEAFVCFHCKQEIKYPAFNYIDSPQKGLLPEIFCGEKCIERSEVEGEGFATPRDRRKSDTT